MLELPSPDSTPTILPSHEGQISGYAASVTPEEEEGCIDIEALNGLPSDVLIYKRAKRASVLCNKNRSCATPGHMVLWDKKPMTMRSYCSQWSVCKKVEKWVNSPCMLSGVRIESRTKLLQYTAFASRFETWLEHTIFSALLRAGL